MGVPANATMPMRNRVTPLVLSTHSKELRVSAGVVSSRHHNWLAPTAARAKPIQAMSPTLRPSARSSCRASAGVPTMTAASVSTVARPHVKRGYVTIAAVSTAIAATAAWAASTSEGANLATMRKTPAAAKRPPDRYALTRRHSPRPEMTKSTPATAQPTSTESDVIGTGDPVRGRAGSPWCGPLHRACRRSR